MSVFPERRLVAQVGGSCWILERLKMIANFLCDGCACSTSEFCRPKWLYRSW